MYTNYISEKFYLFINNLVDNIPSIILSIFIFIIFYIIAEYYKSNLIPQKTKLIKSEIEMEYVQELSSYKNDLIYYQLSWLVYYSIIIFGLLVSLVNLGFNVATIITLLGSIGFALALALQDSIKNIISGIYIGINKLFKIGDLISLKPLGNLNATYGRIIDFSLYYTTIVDNNNVISMIPNSIIQSNILTNISLSKNYNDKNQ
jgi:small-conductance mechanosensitive channel